MDETRTTNYKEIRSTIICMISCMKDSKSREQASRFYARIDGAINAFSMTYLITIDEMKELCKMARDAFAETHSKLTD